MGFLKKLFGKEATETNNFNNQEDLITNLQENFDRDWYESLSRFVAITKLNVGNFKLKHPQTHEEMLPHEGLGGTFSDWLEIQARYDQRGLLFNELYGFFSKSMNDWQVANYLVLDRRPNLALEVLETSEDFSDDENFNYAEYYASYVKALINLGRYKEALDWAEKAIEKSPKSNSIITLLADAKHLNGQCEDAHKIYSSLMSQVPQKTTEDLTEMFSDLFAKDTGIVSSPILAFDMLENLENSEQTDLFWQLAETEFYDSAYFRMQHSYYLAKKGKTMESFAKLQALVGEMPWLKEASLNLANYFAEFDPTGENLFPEFQAELRQRIKENGWTTDGMREINLEY